MRTKVAYFLVGLFIVVLTIVGRLLVTHYTQRSDYKPPKDEVLSIPVCISDGLGGKHCKDREESRKSYLEGNNEFQDFVRKPEDWKNINFDSY